jgi:hypothetical protein
MSMDAEAALCACPQLAALSAGGVTACPFCDAKLRDSAIDAHCHDRCLVAQPFVARSGALTLPRRCTGLLFGVAEARLQPYVAWLRSLADALAPPAPLLAACSHAAARAAAVVAIAPDTALDTSSTEALLASLAAAAADGRWAREGALLLRAPDALGLPSAELAAYLARGCAAVRKDGAPLLGEVFTQRLPAQLWEPLPCSAGAVPGLASPAQFSALAARVDAAVDTAWAAMRAPLCAAVPGLDRTAFCEALLQAGAACGCPVATVYAPMAATELLNSVQLPTLLDTRLLPRVTHGVEDATGEAFVDVDDSYSGELHPCAAAALSLRDGGLLGLRGQAHSGTSLPVTILASAGGSTPLHVEDFHFASYNANLHGAAKTWYVVPPGAAHAFVEAVRDAMPPAQRPYAAALLGTKRLHVTLAPEALRRLGVRRIVQLPGDIVLTAPGPTFHWTMATGFCVAESLNLMPRCGDEALEAHAARAGAWMRQVTAAPEACGGVAAPDGLSDALEQRAALEAELHRIMMGESDSSEACADGTQGALGTDERGDSEPKRAKLSC